MSGRLYVGIDLGTFQSTIASSAGAMHSVETVVGRPKDPVARNFLKRDVLFGADALKNKLACNLYRPMAAGVAQDDEANLAAAKAFVSHLIETVDPEEFDEVFGVICSPSHVSFTDKSNLVATLRGQVNAIMVVTEPFATAFAIGEIGGSIVVDIGAGTTDIARIHGTFPTDEDQVTIQEAGDWLDLELKNLIAKKFTGAQITKDMVRKWKEESSYVGGDVRTVEVSLSVDGKSQNVDIGDLIQEACELLVLRSVTPSSASLLKQTLSTNRFCETTSSSPVEVPSSKDLQNELLEKSPILVTSTFGALKTHWKRSLKVHSCSQVKCLTTCTPPSTDLVYSSNTKIRRLMP